MRPLLVVSLVILVVGLSLGLVNLYIDGRIGAPTLLGIVAAGVALTALMVNISARK